MTDTKSKKIAYFLNYNLPIKSIVSCNGELRLRFTMGTAFSEEQSHLDIDIEGTDIQPHIDEFFKKVAENDLAYVILDVADHVGFDPVGKVTTINIKVLFIGHYAQEFIKKIKN